MNLLLLLLYACVCDLLGLLLLHFWMLQTEDVRALMRLKSALSSILHLRLELDESFLITIASGADPLAAISTLPVLSSPSSLASMLGTPWIAEDSSVDLSMFAGLHVLEMNEIQLPLIAGITPLRSSLRVRSRFFCLLRILFVVTSILMASAACFQKLIVHCSLLSPAYLFSQYV